MKILAVTGIRSDYDILYPVLNEIHEAGHELSLVISGAHLSEQHSNTWQRIAADGFTIADKIDTLLSTDRVVQRSKGTGLLIQGLTQTSERIDPDFLLVLGDREESIATAIVGNYLNILVVHIGGGDPVYGNADDPMRFAVSKLAHLHCCFAKEYASNLLAVGEEEFRIYQTGNPAYVNIDRVPSINRRELKEVIGIKEENYIVLIEHPLSSEVDDSYHQMATTLDALEHFCNKNNYQTVCITPNSDPGSFEIRKAIDECVGKPWFISVETLPRIEFINLMRRSKALIGNSSMGILEAPHYKLPVVNVGNRQKGRLNAGNVDFVSHKKDEIVASLERACLDKVYRKNVEELINPYGDSTSAEKVRKAIESVNIEDPKWYTKQKLC